MVTTISGLLGLVFQTPIGAAIDWTRAKRGAIVLALAVLSVAAIIIFAWPSFWPVLFANSLMAIVGDVFGPAVAALTLGLFARKQLARRMGRNSAFDHAGNVGIAVVAAAVGYAFSQRAVFLLVPVFAGLASIAVLSIPATAIDYNRARDLDDEHGAAAIAPKPADYAMLFKSRPLVVFGLCVMLFHLANAALLPLVGQKLAAAHPEEATAMMSACIVAAQAVMLPIALLVGRTADSWGRKPLFLAGFTILPVRAVLYTLSDNSFWLSGVVTPFDFRYLENDGRIGIDGEPGLDICSVEIRVDPICLSNRVVLDRVVGEADRATIHVFLTDDQRSVTARRRRSGAFIPATGSSTTRRPTLWAAKISCSPLRRSAS